MFIGDDIREGNKVLSVHWDDIRGNKVFWDDIREGNKGLSVHWDDIRDTLIINFDDFVTEMFLENVTKRQM